MEREEKQQVPPLRFAPVGACDFFDLACSLWLESSEEHLPTSIAGVPSAGSGQALRLRAISRPLCDRSARRFAQDDGFVGGEKHPVSYAENTKRSKKSQALGMTKERAGFPLRVVAGPRRFFITLGGRRPRFL